ncbi:MAG: soxR [Hyphomicrobiales bacterium]|jgi:MerR family redox-sensitive transcriptional activator SoxR|nr:soxR [Hyphomicrobiales bacterium]
MDPKLLSTALLTVGELAKRSGVAVSTLHFYEQKKLIASTRTSGNQRRYPRYMLRRVAIIRAAQRVGISLKEIRETLAGLPIDGKPTSAQWSRMSKHWRAQLDLKIARLIALRSQLDSCIGCGCLSLSDCPLRNPWDELGAQSSGPVLLEEAAVGARLGR